jgi:hypothetical protein
MASRAANAWSAFMCAFTMLALLIAAPAHALDRQRDLGAIPASGGDAATTLPDRQQRVIRELACGDEAEFMRALRDTPDKRPLSNLVAKAAAIVPVSRAGFACMVTETFDKDEWDSNFQYESSITQPGATKLPMGPAVVLVDASWPALKDAIDSLYSDVNKGIGARPDWNLRATMNAREIERLLDRIEGNIYGKACSRVVLNVSPFIWEPASGNPAIIEYRVNYLLTTECLEQQIATLILARDFQRTTNPGTNGLPCVLFGKTEGDWDMTVINLTRTIFFLRQAKAKGLALSDPVVAAMDKMMSRLLTLSGPPAVEVHAVAACGNPDNQYGSARQRLDDKTFYDPELQREVEGSGQGGSSLLDFLGGLLLFLALLVAGLALAAIAAILGALFGPFAAVIIAAGLAIAVALGIPQTIIGSVFGGIEETENHLFMQNSSKYLMNKLLMEQLFADKDEKGIKDYEEFNRDLRNWFMNRLQGITENDFAEYNAKPYSRLSIASILNLHDFVCEAGYRTPNSPDKCSADDRKLTTATEIVLDLTAAKAALGTNQSRRIIPFRRLAHSNANFSIGRRDKGVRSQPFRLLDFGQTADHMEAAIQLWTGMTFHGPGGHASNASLGEMIWEASSTYRPNALILDLAIDKSKAYQQSFHHSGWERYSSGPGWMLTAGGSSTGYAQGFVTPFGKTYPSLFIKQTDRGAGVPTTLIVSSGKRADPCPSPGCMPERRAEGARQDLWADFIRFEGRPEKWKEDGDDEPMTFDRNFCVTGNFACGIHLRIPSALSSCLVATGGIETPSPRVFWIGDSSDKDRCALWDDGDPNDDFYVILYAQPCAPAGEACGRGSLWGFLEIVPKASFADRNALASTVLSLNAGNFDAMGRSGGRGTLTYQSMTQGKISFDPAGSFVRSSAGVAMDSSARPNWKRAEGDIINRTGQYRFTIRNPRSGQTISVDFSDRKNPKRVAP